jgi:RimJ/RimL family protein N-acetyltransferase
VRVLQRSEYGIASGLAGALHDQGMALSVLAGVRPGAVVVNELADPTALLIGAPEGGFAWTYLAGDASDARLLHDLRAWVFDRHGLGADVGFSFLACDRPEWEKTLAGLIEPRAVIPDRRLHYERVSPPNERKPPLPPGYEIRDLDRDLLESGVTIHPQVSQWMTANFGSPEGFLAHGLGAVALHDGEMIGWFLADSFVDGACDIGGEVEETHRRNGLAHALACRCVDLAFDRGARRVGWHCHAINLPSVRTAEKAGFSLRRAYTVYPIHFDAQKHETLVGVVAGEYLEDADAALTRGEFGTADELLSRMLDFASDPTPDALHSAARAAAGTGDVERAFARLEQAIAAGWTNGEVTRSLPEFAPLSSDPRWTVVCQKAQASS